LICIEYIEISKRKTLGKKVKGGNSHEEGALGIQVNVSVSEAEELVETYNAKFHADFVSNRKKSA